MVIICVYPLATDIEHVIIMRFVGFFGICISIFYEVSVHEFCPVFSNWVDCLFIVVVGTEKHIF